jgi:small subunit ribosomal protein S5
VTKVTKGGRTFTFAAIVVVGNENGVVGHGLGKAKEVQEAIAKGIDDAKKNLVKVPVMQRDDPAHRRKASSPEPRCFLKPAAHGTGVIAGGAMRAVLESVGVTDVLAKSKGSSNPHNVVKATIEALDEHARCQHGIRVSAASNWNAYSTDNNDPLSRSADQTMSKSPSPRRTARSSAPSARRTP